ncbi:MAG: helix-turn-helix domain-containing protein [Clostridiales bacterium]|jgi:DNA-binding Xre family transcriptional regulator|nr:helix-turn-helix domain-containing protein [Clostridiales bacterium]
MNKRIRYNRLWKLLIDKGMSKTDLKHTSVISTTSIAKMGKGENITTDVILKICNALDCGTDEIMEVVEDKQPENQN